MALVARLMAQSDSMMHRLVSNEDARLAFLQKRALMSGSPCRRDWLSFALVNNLGYARLVQGPANGERAPTLNCADFTHNQFRHDK